MQIKELIHALEVFAPPVYQEDYDNAGLITGQMNMELTGALITLDCTEVIIAEAISKGCNLIIAHHPIVFKGLKRFNGNSYVERTIIKAIKHDIAIYAIHTNLDNVLKGVNRRIADRLELIDTRILLPKKGILTKLTTFVPQAYTQAVLNALYDAGAGDIGDYDHCSFQSPGTGSFRPRKNATPSIGQVGKDESVAEHSISVIMPSYLKSNVIRALKNAHPYEEVAYDLQKLENEHLEVGSGMIGELSTPMSYSDFLAYLCEKMEIKQLKHTPLLPGEVKKVALCGGAGSFLLRPAIQQKADIYISADFKYHEYFDAEDKVVIADIGHYESEVFTKDLIYETLREKFSNIALILSEEDTNPVKYYIV